jgi:hypothetical protein
MNTSKESCSMGMVGLSHAKTAMCFKVQNDAREYKVSRIPGPASAAAGVSGPNCPGRHQISLAFVFWLEDWD